MFIDTRAITEDMLTIIKDTLAVIEPNVSGQSAEKPEGL